MKSVFFACILAITSSQFIGAAQAQSNFAYYGLEPDIVTNFLGSNATNLGFVRTTIELMLEDADYIEAIEHHSPLLRATVIDILGRQPKDKVKSLTGREDFRRTSLEQLRELMEKETGKPMIKDIIITKFIVQGG
ncbi:MAG: flagellar basal body-associated protein FliL [Aliiglaciecola sp.]|uniref:flagellar basal body-associated protein FliL n=1 Tax=unclassified Aliiglaciecola TaxID=2593648 RepID=UPI003296EC20